MGRGIYFQIVYFVVNIVLVCALNTTDLKCDNDFALPLDPKISRVSRSIPTKNKAFSLDSLLQPLLNKEDSDNEMGLIRQPRQDGPLPLPTQVLDELFGRRLFNSTMNYIVPMFHVMLPLHTDSGSTVHLAMQAFLGLFSAIAWIATIAIPTLLTELRPFGFKRSAGNQNSEESLFYGFKLKFPSLFEEKISKKIGLDWDTCVQKTACQAYQSPKKYGLLALPFLIFYPSADWNNQMSNSLSHQIINNQEVPVSKTFSESDLDCENRYKCFFDVLDLMNYLIHLCNW